MNIEDSYCFVVKVAPILYFIFVLSPLSQKMKNKGELFYDKSFMSDLLYLIRTFGALGCTQSLLPLVAGTRLTSHLTVNMRACCELYHGTFQRSCQDR